MTYTGSCSGIFEVDWNQRGDRIAAATGNGTVICFIESFKNKTVNCRCFYSMSAF